MDDFFISLMLHNVAYRVCGLYKRPCKLLNDSWIISVIPMDLDRIREQNGGTRLHPNGLTKVKQCKAVGGLNITYQERKGGKNYQTIKYEHSGVRSTKTGFDWDEAR